MNASEFFLWFWTGLIFASIAWYGFLLFHVGVKAAGDIRRMTRHLRRRSRTDQPES